MATVARTSVAAACSAAPAQRQRTSSALRAHGATPARAAAVRMASRSSASLSLAATITHRRAQHAVAARRSVTTRASADAAAADVAPPEGKGGFTLMNVVKLVCVFTAWYGFNIYFNIYNKQLLKMFPYPISATAFQFLGGTVIACVMWLFNLHEKPKGITGKQLLQILPLAAIHTLGNTLTNISLGAVAVSFTHTIKASEPFFSAIFSAVFLGQVPTLPVIGCLIPIVGGVALASFSEASFNMTGFVAAMASNITFTSRNVLSKKMMGGDATKGLDNINLFCILTIMSFLILTPIAMMVEGVRLTPAALTAMNLDPLMIFQRLCFTALCFHGYQQTSYLVLGQVTPVTHSIGNCVKRVVVIVSAVIFFQTPVSPINALGTAMALGGVFAYTQVKRMSGDKL